MSRGITIGLGTNVRLLADSGANVCFGSGADIARHRANVRFTPESGH